MLTCLSDNSAFVKCCFLFNVAFRAHRKILSLQSRVNVQTLYCYNVEFMANNKQYLSVMGRYKENEIVISSNAYYSRVGMG